MHKRPKIIAAFSIPVFLCLCFLLNAMAQKKSGPGVIVDCDFSFTESVSGINIPRAIKQNLELIDVHYYSFDQKLHKGQLLIHTSLSAEIKDIFREIEADRFPIAKVIPIVKYGWSDSASMADDNTSAFNYRLVKGTRVLSAHSGGRAIDINPLENPQFTRRRASPAGARYDSKAPGTITPSSVVVSAFRKRGWKWGGNWRSTKDYQHFEKPSGTK
ncbi:MAG: M15 family metallopeptidase [Ignavibacteriales bacterium]